MTTKYRVIMPCHKDGLWVIKRKIKGATRYFFTSDPDHPEIFEGYKAEAHDVQKAVDYSDCHPLIVPMPRR